MACMHYGHCHGCGAPIVVEEDSGAWEPYAVRYPGYRPGWGRHRRGRPTKDEEREALQEYLAEVREELRGIEKRLAALEGEGQSPAPS